MDDYLHNLVCSLVDDGGKRMSDEGSKEREAMSKQETGQSDSTHKAVMRRLMLGRRVIFAVIGERSAVHFWVEPNWENNEKSRGGVEFHERPEDGRDPDNEDCWLLNGPCCHDGSSRYASEKVIPTFHRCCKTGDGNYDPVWYDLESTLELKTSKQQQEEDEE